MATPFLDLHLHCVAAWAAGLAALRLERRATLCSSMCVYINTTVNGARRARRVAVFAMQRTALTLGLLLLAQLGRAQLGLRGKVQPPKAPTSKPPQAAPSQAPPAQPPGRYTHIGAEATADSSAENASTAAPRATGEAERR